MHVCLNVHVVSVLQVCLPYEFILSLYAYMCNDRTVLYTNFKAVGQTQAELHSLKVEKVNACIRSLFADSATFVRTYVCYTTGIVKYN